MRQMHGRAVIRVGVFLLVHVVGMTEGTGTVVSARMGSIRKQGARWHMRVVSSSCVAVSSRVERTERMGGPKGLDGGGCCKVMGGR